MKPRSRRWTASFDAIYLDVSSALLLPSALPFARVSSYAAPSPVLAPANREPCCRA
ncbi:MAG TPA: hypothetical protein VOA80_00955 [Thermoanaerobaculia bacterium]|nr:hypothetical protein [Thermoanaerobaculia bacterium]